MAKIHTYATYGNISIADKIIGTDGDIGANNATKNFTVGALQTFMGNSFAPKTDFETLQTTVSTGVHKVIDGDILGPAGSVTSTVISLGTRELSTGSLNNIQQTHAKLLPGKLQLCGNSGFATGALAVIRAGHVGTSPTQSNFGKFFTGLPGDGSGVVLIQNETEQRSSVIMLKSTSAASSNTVFVVGSGPNNMNNTVSSGYAEIHTPLLRITGKADLYLASGSNLNSNVYAKKFISVADSTYHVEPAFSTKLNHLQVNRITPITSGSTSGAASSIFEIPKVSNLEQNAFNASSNMGGVLGQILFDDNYIYICTVAGSPGSATWKRAALSTF